MTQVSVIMPAYNVADFIGDAIKSVLTQSFKDFELIIVNDGSCDDTVKVVRSFQDERIVLIDQPNQGIAAALNKGLLKAKADLIARFDADDICYPHRLAKQYKFLSENPDYVIAGSSADYIDQDGSYVFTNYPAGFSHDEICMVAKKTCPFVHSSVIYKKEAVLKHGGYNIHAHSFEDHLLWLSVLKEGKGMNFCEPLIQVRLNTNSITIDEKWRPKAFHRIKEKVIKDNHITEAQGDELLHIIRTQNQQAIKESAYHALLAKKFLWNNHQPLMARQNLSKVISKNRLHLTSYFFYALSYLPKPVVQNAYRLLKSPGYSFTNQKQNNEQ